MIMKKRKGSVCVLSHRVVSESFTMLWTVPCQAALPMEFSRQENWVGCHFLLQVELLGPRIKPVSLAAPVLGRSLGRPLATWEAF